MDETRRFLRYVIPGLVFGVEILAFVMIAVPDWTLALLGKAATKDGVGIALGTFLASGALGYIFAALHHSWLWWAEHDVLDHRDLVKSRSELMDKSRCELLEDAPADIENNKKNLTREDAMVRAWAYWYGDSKALAGISAPGRKKLDSLGDQAHGMGAARVASLFALAIANWICAEVGTFVSFWEIMRWALMVVLGGVVFAAFHCGFRRVARIALGLWERLVFKTLPVQKLL